jgi:hypothetical protein
MSLSADGRAILAIIAGGLAFQGCGSDSQSSDLPSCPGVTVATCPEAVPSYAGEIAPIIDARCNHCHAPGNPDGLWPLTDHASVKDWSDTILRDVGACIQPPPRSGYALTLDERNALEGWLLCGAPDN